MKQESFSQPGEVALEKLKNLLPGQFDEVVFKYGCPSEYLTTPASQTAKAIELIRYANQHEEKNILFLLTVIDEVSKLDIKASSIQRKNIKLLFFVFILLLAGLVAVVGYNMRNSFQVQTPVISTESTVAVSMFNKNLVDSLIITNTNLPGFRVTSENNTLKFNYNGKMPDLKVGGAYIEIPVTDLTDLIFYSEFKIKNYIDYGYPVLKISFISTDGKLFDFVITPDRYYESTIPHSTEWTKNNSMIAYKKELDSFKMSPKFSKNLTGLRITYQVTPTRDYVCRNCVLELDHLSIRREL